LKLTLATKQRSLDDSLKRRQVGAALAIAFLILPLFIVSGFLAAWLFPALFKINAQLESIVKWSIIIMTIDAALRNFTSIPSSILRAMNIDYAAMGVSTAVTIITGLLNIVVVLAGWGLVGLAINTLIASLASSAIRLYIVKKRVQWFGMERPTRDEVKVLIGRSAYFTLDAATTTLGQRSENLIIGGVLGTSVVAIYNLTRTFARACFEIIYQVLSSANAGIADIAGGNDAGLLKKLRSQMLKIVAIITISTTALVIIWNQSFITLWVGPDKYGGLAVTALVAVLFSCRAFVSVNRNFMGALLLIKEDSISSSVKNVFSFILMLFAAYHSGLPGILGAMIIGEIGLAVYLSAILEKHVPLQNISVSRILISAGMLAVISLILKQAVGAPGWPWLCAGVALSYSILCFLMIVMVFNKADYSFWSDRFKILQPGNHVKPV
jgi:O-antigen/teichoic acid export membrane protein